MHTSTVAKKSGHGRTILEETFYQIHAVSGFHRRMPKCNSVLQTEKDLFQREI